MRWLSQRRCSRRRARIRLKRPFPLLPGRYQVHQRSSQPQPARAELPRALQPHLVEQHPRHLRIIRRRFDLRGKQLQLLCFALFVEDFDLLSQRA
jgi:hypothetical protein